MQQQHSTSHQLKATPFLEQFSEIFLWMTKTNYKNYESNVTTRKKRKTAL